MTYGEASVAEESSCKRGDGKEEVQRNQSVQLMHSIIVGCHCASSSSLKLDVNFYKLGSSNCIPSLLLKSLDWTA